MPLPPQVGIIPCSAPAVKENLPRSSRNFRGFPCEKVLKKFSLRVKPAGGFCVGSIRRSVSGRTGASRPTKSLPLWGRCPRRGRKGPCGAPLSLALRLDSSPAKGGEPRGGRPKAAPTSPNGRGRWAETPHPSRPSAVPPSPKGEGFVGARCAPLHRRRKLHIPRFRLAAKAHSFRCSDSPHRTRGCRRWASAGAP